MMARWLRETRYLRGAAHELLVEARLAWLTERRKRSESERLRRRAQEDETERGALLLALARDLGTVAPSGLPPEPDPVLSALTRGYDNDAVRREHPEGDPGVTSPRGRPSSERLNLGGSTAQNFPPTTSELAPAVTNGPGVPSESRAPSSPAPSSGASAPDGLEPSETLPEDLVVLVERLEALALLAPDAVVERLPTFTPEEVARQRLEAVRERGARKYKRPPKPLPPKGARHCRWCIGGRVTDTSLGPGGESWECLSCGGTGIAYVSGQPEAEKPAPEKKTAKVVRRRKLADGTFEETEVGGKKR